MMLDFRPRRSGVLPRCATFLLCTGVLLSVAACGDGDDGSAAPADALHVGYAEVSAPWRLGAKPGQVGSAALPERDRLLLRALGQLRGVLSPGVDPVTHVQGATDWVLGMLEERVAATEPGRYATLFEPGIGLEEPPVMKALVVRRGDSKVAIVRADLYLGHEQIQRRIAALVEAETGIGRDQVFFVATHNHSGPHAVSPSPGIWILADAFDPRHFVYVTRAIADAVIEADRNAQPATLRTGVREFRAVQHNIIGPTTIVATNPDGVQEPVPVGYPRDHIDPDLVSLRFDAAETGAPLAHLFIFGMHPESLPDGHGILSGEWPTHVENKLRERTGAPAIWLPGPLGDSEPDRGHIHPEHQFMRAGFAAMETMSTIIADAAEEAWSGLAATPADPAPRFDQVTADLPGVEGFPVPTSAYLGPRFPMVRVLHDSATVRLHAIRLGDVLLLGTPGEITTDLAFSIKSRVDRVAGNVYQGYEWPAAPTWVKERVRRNFTTDELEPEQGAPIPVVLSHVNGYMGYVVTAWEYENRAHYRQEMTAFGARTADHIASALVGMTRAMEGGLPFAVELPEWHAADLEGVERIQDFLAGLDAQVVEMSRSLPATDPARAGSALADPPLQTAAGTRVSFSWTGGTNDMDPPQVRIERRIGETWSEVRRGPSRDVVLYFQAPDTWTAEWQSAAAPTDAVLRFRVDGTYRGTTADAAVADPIWDPEGRNRSYTAVSRSFGIEG
jgi:hypothetical protein